MLSSFDQLLEPENWIYCVLIFFLASNDRILFNVSYVLDSVDKNKLESTITGCTKWCSRHLLQDIIIVSAVSLYFFLFWYILGFLLTFVSLQLLDLKTLSALKYMLNFYTYLLISISLLLGLVYITNVSALSGMSEALLKYALSQIYLNPHIWAHSSYKVQRELYLVLIQYFEADGKLLPILCGLPKIIDIVRLLILYYISVERPYVKEFHKIRLLLLRLAEMSLK